MYYILTMNEVWSRSKERIHTDIDDLLYAYENELFKENTEYMKRMLLMDDTEKLEKEIKISNLEKNISIIRRIQSRNLDYITDTPVLTFCRISSSL
jgi:uncharacterized membrane protein YgaE (UPF0421/DUF939 family)